MTYKARDYVFKIGDKVVGVGIMFYEGEIIIGEFNDNYEDFINDLQSEEFDIFADCVWVANFDDYSKKGFIKKLKKYNQEGEFLGIIEWGPNRPYFI